MSRSRPETIRTGECLGRISGREAVTDILTIVGRLSAPDNRRAAEVASRPSCRDGACPVSNGGKIQGGKIQGSYQGIALAMPKVSKSSAPSGAEQRQSILPAGGDAARRVSTESRKPS